MMDSPLISAGVLPQSIAGVSRVVKKLIRVEISTSLTSIIRATMRLCPASNEACNRRIIRVSGGDYVDGARILAYITGTVDQELLLRNEYLVAENRILV
jgi:hypothetical protein